MGILILNIYPKLISKRLRGWHNRAELNRPIMNQFLNHLFNMIFFQGHERLMADLRLGVSLHRQRLNPGHVSAGIEAMGGGFLKMKRRHTATVEFSSQIGREEFRRRGI